jgi:hypothetical protein
MQKLTPRKLHGVEDVQQEHLGQEAVHPVAGGRYVTVAVAAAARGGLHWNGRLCGPAQSDAGQAGLGQCKLSRSTATARGSTSSTRGGPWRQRRGRAQLVSRGRPRTTRASATIPNPHMNMLRLPLKPHHLPRGLSKKGRPASSMMCTMYDS